MANNQKVDNNVLGQYQVETVQQSDGSHRQVVAVGNGPGGSNATVQYAAVASSGSGDNTLVAAVSAKKIRVLSVFIVAAGAVSIRFESGAGGTALTGVMAIAENGGFVLPFNPVGWFETATNTLLNLELSGAVSCSGSLVYQEV